MLIWVNAESTPLRCALPPGRWLLEIDSSRDLTHAQPIATTIEVPAQALLVLIQEDEP